MQLLVEKNRLYVCKNIDCQKEFDDPKVITYHVCPFCETRVDYNENSRKHCSHYFGYLGEREIGKAIPSECIECMKSIECMLNKISSKDAAQEIQKWFV